MAKVLIIEDDRKINELMVRTLSINGHECLPAFTGKEALLAAKGQTVDLALLDINLPDMDGFRVMGELGNVPVIYVTARNEIHDRVRGLDGGAEDYIVKPFHIQELISRVNVVLRRYQREEIFCLGTVKVDLKNCRIFLGETEAVLTKREFELLKALIYNKNLTLTREQLINAAWGFDYDGEERTVDVHIQRIRKKLDKADKWKERYGENAQKREESVYSRLQNYQRESTNRQTKQSSKIWAEGKDNILSVTFALLFLKIVLDI